MMVNVSAILFVTEYQFINIVIELNVKNVVLPPTEPVTDIVQIMSLAVQSKDVEVTLYGITAWEPAVSYQMQLQFIKIEGFIENSYGHALKI